LWWRRSHALTATAALAAAAVGLFLCLPEWENSGTAPTKPDATTSAWTTASAPLPAPTVAAPPAPPEPAPVTPDPPTSAPVHQATGAAAQLSGAAPAAEPPGPTEPAPAAPSAAASAPALIPAAPAGPVQPVIEVKGFRSALFGMNEAQVRAAMEKDFKLRPAEIKVAENPVEKTRVLIATVADPLSGGGKAQISYVLGYKSKKLIQVGLVWARATDRDLTSERLIANAQVLQAYFRGAGYRPGSIAVNAPFAKGVVAFRGSDAGGHATVLILEGKIGRNKSGALVLTEAHQLSLFYSVDPEHPDVAAVARPQ